MTNTHHTSDPHVRLGDRITLHYRISSMGQTISDTFKEDPETFSLGGGELAPPLEGLLLGLAVNARHTWQLAPWQAFGERDEALIQQLSRSEFHQPDEILQPGHRIDFELPNGEILSGTLLSITEDSVQIDFNHPLAGLPIEFEAQVLAIERGTHDAE